MLSHSPNVLERADEFSAAGEFPHPGRARVLIIDDHEMFRTAVAQWLDQQQNFVCCGAADSGAAGRLLIDQFNPDIVLLDLRLSDGSGLDLLPGLSRRRAGARFLVFSFEDESVYAPRAIEAGACGYLLKSEGIESLLLALETVLKGEIFASTSACVHLPRFAGVPPP